MMSGEHPLRSDYSQVFQDANAVEKYDEIEYAVDSQASAVNRRQRRYLRRLVESSFGQTQPVQHDFACGTGRAVGLLEDLVREAHGYDVSPQMLQRAEHNGHPAAWHVIAATGPIPAPEPTSGPAIVTIFRLLLNVPDDVRDRAIAFAARALPPSEQGLLVVQNHGNRRSLRHLRARGHRDNPWYSELSDAQVHALFARHGFVQVGRRGCAILPRGWYGPRLTRPFMQRLDGLLCALRVFDRWAVDVLHVASRSSR
jgi:SAM-dependent methyltransferase